MLRSLKKLSQMIEKDPDLQAIIRSEVLCEIPYKDQLFPIHAFTLGSENPKDPVLFITGGIHGLERIGVQVVWSLLKTTVDRLRWDQSLRDNLKNIRIAAIPLVNPVGFERASRSNGNDVDLMRNSPITATTRVPLLLGGHRWSKQLPWHRGEPGKLELENQALYNYFFQQAGQSSCVISVDFHSGFGMKDRLWFPYSHTVEPFEFLPEMNALTHLFEQTYPYHIYQIEPQSQGYLMSGDMWDYMLIEFMKSNPNPYLPLTLEMGSWTWVRKNPIQMFSRGGFFNPIKEHRLKRTYRRHNLLFEFLMRTLRSKEAWLLPNEKARLSQRRKGLERWYEK